MRQLKRCVAIAVLMLGLVPGLWAQMMQEVVPGEVRVFHLTARRNQFSPFVVIVKPGDRVQLVITAVDRDYGFDLPAFHIHKKLKQGVPTPIDLTAAAPGKFIFRSPDLGRKFLRREMKGTLVVKGNPNESAPAAPNGGR
ncbi:MAG TPA: cupredoxin domain-containing protein [Terriglobia bacterium]|nr:cupredoxin domain-containing protein [Terriglobia bacterium]